MARSSAIGVQLYVLDTAAAIATDVLRAELPDPRAHRIAGYVPMRELDAEGHAMPSCVVSFFTRDVPPAVAAEVHVAPKASPRLRTFSPPKEVSPQLVPLIRARQLAIGSVPRPTQPLNPVSLPGEVSGEHGILVYLLAGTTKSDVAVLGRHFRALVSQDGTRMLRFTPLSKTVLEIPTRTPVGATAVNLGVSHIVTEYPLETHVFASLLTRLPIHVSTRRGTWSVDGAKIDFLGGLLP